MIEHVCQASNFKNGTYLLSEVTAYHQRWELVLERSCGLFTWLLRNIWRFGFKLLLNSSFSRKSWTTTSLAQVGAWKEQPCHNCRKMLVHKWDLCPPKPMFRESMVQLFILLPSRSPQRISILLTKPQSRCKRRFSSATSISVDLTLTVIRSARYSRSTSWRRTIQQISAKFGK